MVNATSFWLSIIILLFGVVLIVSIIWTQFRGAPWVPSSMKKVHKMLKMAAVGPNDVVCDLGCGDGRTVITAARSYGSRAIGIEIDPLRYLWCELLVTVLGLRSRVKIVFGDFYSQDLNGVDVVTCYLLPSTNIKLEAKLMRELSPSARVVSKDFTFPGLKLVYENLEDDIYMYHPIPRDGWI
jgi:hypothetical protein